MLVGPAVPSSGHFLFSLNSLKTGIKIHNPLILCGGSFIQRRAAADQLGNPFTGSTAAPAMLCQAGLTGYPTARPTALASNRARESVSLLEKCFGLLFLFSSLMFHTECLDCGKSQGFWGQWPVPKGSSKPQRAARSEFEPASAAKVGAWAALAGDMRRLGTVGVEI